MNQDSLCRKVNSTKTLSKLTYAGSPSKTSGMPSKLRSAPATIAPPIFAAAIGVAPKLKPGAPYDTVPNPPYTGAAYDTGAAAYDTGAAVVTGAAYDTGRG